MRKITRYRYSIGNIGSGCPFFGKSGQILSFYIFLFLILTKNVWPTSESTVRVYLRFYAGTEVSSAFSWCRYGKPEMWGCICTRLFISVMDPKSIRGRYFLRLTEKSIRTWRDYMDKKHQYFTAAVVLLIIAGLLVIGSIAPGPDTSKIALVSGTDNPGITAESPGTSGTSQGTGTSNSATGTTKVTTIHVGSTLPGQIGYVLLNKEGFLADEFSKDNIRVEFDQFLTDDLTTKAVSAGDIDVAFVSADPLLRSSDYRKTVDVIGVSQFNPVSQSTIIVKADNPVFSVASLKGKKVAFQNGTVHQINLYKALKSAGLNWSDIIPVATAKAPAISDLTNGNVSAIIDDYDNVKGYVTFDQRITTSVRKPVAKILVRGSDHTNWALPGIIAVNSNFAQQNPDLVKRILKQDLSAADWADTHYQNTVNTYADATKLDEANILLVYPYKVFYLNPAISESAIARWNEYESFLKENNLLDTSIGLNSSIETGYLNAVQSAT